VVVNSGFTVLYNWIAAQVSNGFRKIAFTLTSFVKWKLLREFSVLWWGPIFSLNEVKCVLHSSWCRFRFKRSNSILKSCYGVDWISVDYEFPLWSWLSYVSHCCKSNMTITWSQLYRIRVSNEHNIDLHLIPND